MFLNFLLMKNLGAMAASGYTGFRKITDRNVLELSCKYIYMDTVPEKVFVLFLFFFSTKNYWYIDIFPQTRCSGYLYVFIEK